ncbi:potassium transporter TrkA [Natronorubrum sp. JWXQ-INN-674]|uniref:Potassium transporter TrkA n=1 Tax=Natronorubrum halalkaliphilum TaxID=2691917 RepID=A0A6B0VN61_9EURY|nr:TrkA C-terminal domain-containing protein [Natronorubrum halalkaliphilum]MXV62232.1 potassium transporter TrkA [Natronorubrum halalkaliphilum]
MPITETDLPGVGKKFEIDLDGGQILVVVTHNTGRRDVFLKPAEGADSEKLFELSDELARIVGTILEGAYFQPVKTDDRETTLGDGTSIEWFDVPDGSAFAGESLADILADESIEAAIVAVQRGDEVIPASNAERRLRSGDTIIVVGETDSLDRFESRLVDTGGSN